MYEGART